MKKAVTLIVCFALLVFTSSIFSDESKPEKKGDVLAGKIEGLKVENLMTEKLQVAEGTEIVLTHITIPPHTELPLHYHDGEEFIYVLEGSAYVVLKDKEDILLSKGDFFKVPLREVHTAKTTDETAIAIVFRVHESGKPVRVLVE